MEDYPDQVVPEAGRSIAEPEEQRSTAEPEEGRSNVGDEEKDLEQWNVYTTLDQAFQDQLDNPEGPDYAEFRSLVKALLSSPKTTASQLKSQKLFTLLLSRSSSLTIMKSILISEIIARKNFRSSMNSKTIKWIVHWVLLDPSVTLNADFSWIKVPGTVIDKKRPTECFIARDMSDSLLQMNDQDFCEGLKCAAPMWISKELSFRTRLERIKLLHCLNAMPQESEELASTVNFTANQLMVSRDLNLKFDFLFDDSETSSINRDSSSLPTQYPKWLSNLSPETSLLGLLIPPDLIKSFTKDIAFTRVSKMKKALHSLEIAFRLQKMRNQQLNWVTKASMLKKEAFRCLFSIIAFCGDPEMFPVLIQYIEDNMKTRNLAEDAFWTDFEDEKQFKPQKCLVLLPGERSKGSRMTSISFFPSPLVAALFSGETAAACWIVENQCIDLHGDGWKLFLKRLKSSKMYSSPRVKKNVKAVLSEIEKIQK